MENKDLSDNTKSKFVTALHTVIDINGKRHLNIKKRYHWRTTKNTIGDTDNIQVGDLAVVQSGSTTSEVVVVGVKELKRGKYMRSGKLIRRVLELPGQKLTDDTLITELIKYLQDRSRKELEEAEN